jgi:hypothetical protein
MDLPIFCASLAAAAATADFDAGDASTAVTVETRAGTVAVRETFGSEPQKALQIRSRDQSPVNGLN